MDICYISNLCGFVYSAHILQIWCDDVACHLFASHVSVRRELWATISSTMCKCLSLVPRPRPHLMSRSIYVTVARSWEFWQQRDTNARISEKTCLFNKKTCLLVEQEDMSEDMSSNCSTRRQFLLKKKTCLPAEQEDMSSSSTRRQVFYWNLSRHETIGSSTNWWYTTQNKNITLPIVQASLWCCMQISSNVADWLQLNT